MRMVLQPFTNKTIKNDNIINFKMFYFNMIEVIEKVAGKKKPVIVFSKNKEHLFKSGDYVKITKLSEVLEDDNKFKS